jgi:hypothetical protein
LIYIIGSSYGKPINSTALTNAVTGLVTISGIMTAFIGLWVSKLIPAKERATQKYFAYYKKITVFLTVFGILSVIFGLNQLVFGVPVTAYYIVLSGTLIITAVLISIMVFMVFFTEEDAEADSAFTKSL